MTHLLVLNEKLKIAGNLAHILRYTSIIRKNSKNTSDFCMKSCKNINCAKIAKSFGDRGKSRGKLQFCAVGAAKNMDAKNLEIFLKKLLTRG